MTYVQVVLQLQVRGNHVRASAAFKDLLADVMPPLRSPHNHTQAAAVGQAPCTAISRHASSWHNICRGVLVPRSPSILLHVLCL